MTVEEAEHSGLSFEDIKKLLTVNMTTPNEENIELYYAPIKSGNDDDCIYSYQISQNDNYTFKATNSKGRSCEITVPVEIKIKTFNLGISETETKTFEFYEGQTWEDFIGESRMVIIDGVKFTNERDYNYIEIDINQTTGFIQSGVKVASLELNYKIAIMKMVNKLYIKDGKNKTKVLPTDKIVAGGEYCYVLEY